MMFIKSNWLLLLVLIMLVLLMLLFIFQKKSDSGDLNRYKIEEKQEIIDVLTKENDSLLKIVAVPIPDNSITDSLLQVSIDVSNKTLNELRKKNNAHIDSADSNELFRIYSTYH